MLCQFFPFLTLSTTGKLSSLTSWISFELVIISFLIMWRIKPDSELDERERDITLKWKGRMLDWGGVLL
jgi:hypothetical protein